MNQDALRSSYLSLNESAFGQIGTLTALEYSGLFSSTSLADGHAYHELPSALAPSIARLPELWTHAHVAGNPALEDEFLTAFAAVAGTPTLTAVGGSRVCPTASNSIDLVAAYCRANRMRVCLVEPTFDNLALLMRRREVPIIPIDVAPLYEALAAGTPSDVLDADAFDALMIVTPNNPTGIDLDEASFELLAQWCADNHKLFIIDSTFRFFRRTPYDDYALLAETGAEFIAIEDTGKTFPTLDMKASCLVFSQTLRSAMDELYEEVFLCTSGFTLAVLADMLRATHEAGLEAVVWSFIDSRRHALRAAIEHTPLVIAPEAVESCLPVEWIDCSALGTCDRTAAATIREQTGVHLLPGGLFFWSGARGRAIEPRVRASLSKPADQFANALLALGGLETDRAAPGVSTVRELYEQTQSALRGA